MPSRIFLDRDKLSVRYVPEKLPHREKQLRLLNLFFSETFEGREILYARIIQLIGPTGSGKTSSTLLLGRRLEWKARENGISLIHLYTNLKLEASTKFLFYKSLAEKLSKNLVLRSVSAEEQFKLILDYLAKMDMYALLTLDEIDVLRRRNGGVSGIVYDLSRINEIQYQGFNRIIGVLIVARSRDWRKYLDPAVRSTVGQLIVEFPRYTYRQILDILAYRASQAIKAECIGEGVLEFISEITSDYAEGDVRYALDLLLYSGILAENEGSAKITVNHVRKVLKIVSGLPYLDSLNELSKEERVLLLSLIEALKISGTPYVTLSKVKQCYRMLCEERGIRRLADEEIELVLQSLIDRGIVEARGPGKIGLHEADIDALEKKLLKP